MADDDVVVEASAHKAHRDALVALFHANVNEVVSAHNCRILVGENYMQRISEARRQLHMNIECVPQYALIGGKKKRISGAYRYRPDALGREAGDLISAVPQCLPIFGDQPGAFQR